MSGKSRDVSGHLADDGRTVIAPLKGKTTEEIFRAHHNLHPETGEPLPGSESHAGTARGCECDHCAEYQQRGKGKAGKDKDE